jgi:hypothetical protein
MKSLIKAALISCALAAPVFVVAQTSAQTGNEPLTRAQVRADLVRVEQAGYRPAVANDVHYPEDIQAAEAKIAASNNENSVTSASVGGVSAQSASGDRADANGSEPPAFKQIYFGH